MAAVVVATVLALAGCGDPAGSAARGLAGHSLPPNRSVFVPATAAQAEYDKERRDLTLPPGDTFPVSDPNLRPGTTYGLGFGTSDADQIWWCDWGAVWMSTRGAAATDALTTLESVTSTELYQVSYDPNTKQATDGELAQAISGEPAALEADLRQNC